MDKFNAPSNIGFETSDGTIRIYSDPVEGASGYRYIIYQAQDPDTPFKTRYSEIPEVKLLGVKNDEKYLFSMSAFVREADGTENCGEESEKFEFVTTANIFSIEKKVCLTKGETHKLEWECTEGFCDVKFESDNPKVVTVDPEGNITAISKGEAKITAALEKKRYFVSVSVDRDLSDAHYSSVTLAITGDLMCNRFMQEKAAGYEFDFVSGLDEARDRLSFADYRIGVLEALLYDNAPYTFEQKKSATDNPNRNTPSTFLHALKHIGYDMLVTANSYNCDGGTDGLTQTVSHIEDEDILNCGTVSDNPVFISRSGIKIAVIALNMIYNPAQELIEIDDKDRFIGRYSRELAVSLIDEAKNQGADHIICVMHWGNMNSHEVSDIQKEEAKFLADHGADTIVGSHPHVLQKAEYIRSSTGKKVLCAYSLGNFISSLKNLSTNRDSIALILKISKNGNNIRSAASFIPFHTRLLSDGIIQEAVDTPSGTEQADALKRIVGMVGRKIALNRPVITALGSQIITKILGSGLDFKSNKDHLQLSVPSYVTMDEMFTGSQNSVRKDPSSYLILDFYVSASVNLFKLDDVYYTYSNSFINSDLYKDNLKYFTLIEQPKATDVCAEYMESFCNRILQMYDSSNIILIRTSINDKCVVKDQLRSGPSSVGINNRTARLEELFISYVHPTVIDISSYYFRDMTKNNIRSNYEEAYYNRVRKLISESILSNSRRYYHDRDNNDWMDQVIKYYDNMKARAFWTWLCPKKDAADIIVMDTSRSFVAVHSQEIIYLKDKHVRDFSDMKYFDVLSEELREAVSGIKDIRNKKIPKSQHTIDLMLKYQFTCLRDLTALLSAKLATDVSVSEVLHAHEYQDDPDLFIREFANKKYHIDIWGSCVTRSAVATDENVIVNNYIFQQPPMLAFEGEIMGAEAIPKDQKMFNNNPFTMKSMRSALLRDGLSRIAKSTAKWIVVDLYDVVKRGAVIPSPVFDQPSFYEVDDFIMKTGFYQKYFSKYQLSYLFECRDKRLVTSEFIKFCGVLHKKYGKNIILIVTDLKDTYIDLDGELKPLKTTIEKLDERREYLDYFENLFIKQTGCRVINTSLDYLASDAFPLNGAHIVHYESEFYPRTCNEILRIIDEQDS